jgi:hypothetical protein
MTIPGLTTTRLLLALAVLCAATGSVPGAGAALLIVAVAAVRGLARAHDLAPSDSRMPVTSVGTRLAVTTPLAHGRHAA